MEYTIIKICNTVIFISILFFTFAILKLTDINIIDIYNIIKQYI